MKIFFYTAAAVFLLSACFRAEPVTPESARAQWQRVEQLRTNQPIVNLIGTPFEVYVITDSEFARITRTDTLIEKRPLFVGDGAIGRPILDENFFARYTLDEGKDVLEFHLTRNPGQVIRFVADDLKLPSDNSVQIDREARLNGAFNDTETQFVLLTIVNFHYVAFWFDIEPDTDYNEILSITPTHRFDMNDIPAGEDELQSVRFIDGNYYVGTKSGAYRLTPDGQGARPQLIGDTGRWIVDFFKKDNRIFATGFNAFDQHVSLDGGQSWVRPGAESDLQEVEVVGDSVFTQQGIGFPWQLARTDLLKTDEIFYGDEIETDAGSNNSFYGIGYTDGKFYISYDKDIYFIEEVEVVEE